MNVPFWDSMASALSTYVETRQPGQIPCKVRINYRIRNLPLLAFVESASARSCADFICELEAQGYQVIGHGGSASEANWAVIVEPRTDQDTADCIVYEAESVS